MTIVVGNRKGGTGKTTIAYNLGAALALNGKKVCLIDLDSQGNLSGLCRQEPISLDRFREASPIALSPMFAVLPASKNFAQLENELATMIDRNGFIRNEILSKIRSFDHIVIDTSPSLSVLNISAFCASDLVYIVVNPDSFSITGLSEMKAILSQVQKINARLRYRIVLNALFRNRILSGKSLEILKREEAYSGVEIPHRQHFADCNALRKPAIDDAEILKIFEGLIP